MSVPIDDCGNLTCVTERRSITNRCSGKIERLCEDVKLDQLPLNPIVMRLVSFMREVIQRH